MDMDEEGEEGIEEVRSVGKTTNTEVNRETTKVTITLSAPTVKVRDKNRIPITDGVGTGVMYDEEGKKVLEEESGQRTAEVTPNPLGGVKDTIAAIAEDDGNMVLNSEDSLIRVPGIVGREYVVGAFHELDGARAFHHEVESRRRGLMDMLHDEDPLVTSRLMNGQAFWRWKS